MKRILLLVVLVMAMFAMTGCGETYSDLVSIKTDETQLETLADKLFSQLMNRGNADYNYVYSADAAALYGRLTYEEQKKQTQMLQEILDTLKSR